MEERRPGAGGIGEIVLLGILSSVITPKTGVPAPATTELIQYINAAHGCFTQVLLIIWQFLCLFAAGPFFSRDAGLRRYPNSRQLRCS